MNWLTPLLADDSALAREVESAGAAYHSGATSQVMILMTATIGVAVIAGIFCLIFFRKRPRKHTHRSHRHQRKAEAPSGTDDEGSSSADGGSRRRRRVRRMRRPHRPRNPTLAETGGLPPIREGPPPAP